MSILEKPNSDLVQRYIARFDNENKSTEQTINWLVKKFPLNIDFEEIYTKVRVINVLYASRVSAVKRMAENIQKRNIDNDLKNGHIELVKEISIIPTIKNLYVSFASKYCNWHNQKAYPIYDSRARKAIIAYRDQEDNFNFKKKELEHYYDFRKILDEFMKHYNLTHFSYKEIDKFLWMRGKEL